jgi:hypothetical protein
MAVATKATARVQACCERSDMVVPFREYPDDVPRLKTQRHEIPRCHAEDPGAHRT